jgi:hypothetical protein
VTLLTFDLGSLDRPRGHALYYLRTSADPDVILVSYLVILPLSVDVTRYLPPFLTESLGTSAGGMIGDQGAIAWPPIPERFEGIDRLRALATARGDDLIFGGTVNADQVEALMNAVSQAATEYFERYSRDTLALVGSGATGEESAAPDSPSDLSVDEVLYSLLGDRERLSELVKLVGVLRDAVERRDQRGVDAAAEDVRRLGRHLAPKYQVDALVAAAQTPGDRGRRLSELYVERCYRVVNEDYAGLEAVDAQIGALEGSS